jgi:hypothetical protein
MAGELTPTPEPNPVDPKPVSSPRSAQDRKIEKDIIGAEQLAKILPTETDLAAELSEGGYTPAELARFAALQQQALADFIAQGEADATQKAATKNLPCRR